MLVQENMESSGDAQLIYTMNGPITRLLIGSMRYANELSVRQLLLDHADRE